MDRVIDVDEEIDDPVEIIEIGRSGSERVALPIREVDGPKKTENQMSELRADLRALLAENERLSFDLKRNLIRIDFLDEAIATIAESQESTRLKLAEMDAKLTLSESEFATALEEGQAELVSNLRVDLTALQTEMISIVRSTKRLRKG
jgi:hypothetical protein